VIEDALGETVHPGQPMRGREIDPRLPFLGAAFGKRLWRNPELHGQLPADFRYAKTSITQFCAIRQRARVVAIAYHCRPAQAKRRAGTTEKIQADRASVPSIMLMALAMP
jgi:hypothetical protein